VFRIKELKALKQGVPESQRGRFFVSVRIKQFPRQIPSLVVVEGKEGSLGKPKPMQRPRPMQQQQRKLKPMPPRPRN